jgi:hypothetical protein
MSILLKIKYKYYYSITHMSANTLYILNKKYLEINKKEIKTDSDYGILRDINYCITKIKDNEIEIRKIYSDILYKINDVSIEY